MKHIFLTLVLGFFIVQINAQSQATASFTASVTIIQPVGITTTSNMNFASVDAKSGGAVILTPDNTRTASGGIELKEASGLTAATFEITGEPGFAFSLSLPDSEYTLSNGEESMVIKNFTSNLTEIGNFGGGAIILAVGATLDVNPNQAPGIYTTPGAMNVTVNYN